jgi:hypothetical protein
MCHSFIRVSLAQVARNLSAGNSRELVARKTTNKPTTNTCCYSATHSGVHSSGLTTWLFNLQLQNAPNMFHLALEFPSMVAPTSSSLSFSLLSLMHKNFMSKNCCPNPYKFPPFGFPFLTHTLPQDDCTQPPCAQ